MRSLFLVLIYIFNRLWAQVHCAASKFRMAEHAVPDNSMRAVSHVPKFDGTNHREWNYEIDLCFQNLDIADVVLGLELCPDEVNSHRYIFIFFLADNSHSRAHGCSSFTFALKLHAFILQVWTNLTCESIYCIHCSRNPFIEKGFFPFICFTIHCSRNLRRIIHDWLSLVHSYIAHAIPFFGKGFISFYFFIIHCSRNLRRKHSWLIIS